MQRRSVLCLVVAAAIVGCFSTEPVAPTVLLGNWGSNHGSVTAEPTIVNAAFMCTTVSVPGPVRFDAAGSFDVHGLVTSEPGPVRFPPETTSIELLGSLRPHDLPFTLDLVLWMLDSTGVRTGSPTTMTVQQGVTGAEYACPAEGLGNG